MKYSKIIAEAESRFSNPRPQNFPLPWDLMKYIQKEWSPEVYQKLTKTCKYFYASEPWMILDISKNSSNFYKALNEGLNKNLKIWVAGEPNLPSAKPPLFISISHLTPEDKFSQLLHSIKFSSLKHLRIRDRTLSYSDYIVVTEFKSVKSLDFINTNVTAENDESNICLLDDLLKPLKGIQMFIFDFEHSHAFYLKSAKRLANLVVSENLQGLAIYGIPEYISFKYFHQFLQKNPSITLLKLHFRTAGINFINDVQSFYFENFTYETIDFNLQVQYQIFIGNLKIEARFYKICKYCNQGVANKLSDRSLCPSNITHWSCEACRDAFQPGGPCTFCLAGV